MTYRTKSFMKLGKLQRPDHTLRGHFAPAYLGGSNKFRAYLFFVAQKPLSLAVWNKDWLFIISVNILKFRTEDLLKLMGLIFIKS